MLDSGHEVSHAVPVYEGSIWGFFVVTIREFNLRSLFQKHLLSQPLSVCKLNTFNHNEIDLVTQELCSGYAVPSWMKSIEVGGLDVTKYLQHLLAESGQVETADVELYQKMKVRCYLLGNLYFLLSSLQIIEHVCLRA